MHFSYCILIFVDAYTFIHIVHNNYRKSESSDSCARLKDEIQLKIEIEAEAEQTQINENDITTIAYF